MALQTGLGLGDVKVTATGTVQDAPHPRWRKFKKRCGQLWLVVRLRGILRNLGKG